MRTILAILISITAFSCKNCYDCVCTETSNLKITIKECGTKKDIQQVENAGCSCTKQ